MLMTVIVMMVVTTVTVTAMAMMTRVDDDGHDFTQIKRASQTSAGIEPTPPTPVRRAVLSCAPLTARYSFFGFV